MMRTGYLLASFLLCVLAASARAEKVDMSPEELLETATHVVTGKVGAIYERTKNEGDYKRTYYVAEVRVTASEKGKDLKKGDLIYVRYWQQEWIGKGRVPPGTNGHRGIPAEGDPKRFYLARNAYDGFSQSNNDGGFNVIGANGFVALK